jgi:uncharacterized protein
MRLAALFTWLLTASLGAYMLRTWIARGGLRRARSRRGGLPPPLIFGHATLALTGLVLWGSFVASGARALAWAAIGCVMVAAGLGLSTVTLWTPYPVRRAGDHPDEPRSAGWTSPPPPSPSAGGTEFEVTDEMIAQLLEDPEGQRRNEVRPDLAILVPVAHGFLAIATFVLAVMAASATLQTTIGCRVLRAPGPAADTAGMGDRNVIGGELEPCGTDPLTGFYRDGCCTTGPEDMGSHTVCAVVTAEFLEHQRSIGNDLTTPMPQFRFPGLVPGDRWCVTAVNWLRAHEAGAAAPVVLASTHERALEIVPLSALKQHSVDVPADASALDTER